MSMKEIQELQASKATTKAAQGSTLPDEGMVRGADGFLDYAKVPPPWKDRKGSYKADYLYEDVNWIVRKSSKAHHIFGGSMIAFTVGCVCVELYNPMLLH